MTRDEAIELKQSVGWNRYKLVLEKDIEKLKEQLVNCNVPERVALTQERIRTIREMIGARLDSVAEGSEE